ncbi:variable surface lipoprotein, partial [Mycoplasma bovis]|nr:variable surface lipoprotein [Mycoplasmopsis bovis]
MKRKLMLIGGGLIFASSFPMIATSCGVKKKDVETSNSGNQDSK